MKVRDVGQEAKRKTVKRFLDAAKVKVEIDLLGASEEDAEDELNCGRCFSAN